MIKGKDLIGRNIVTIQEGKHLDKVNDLIFDYEANRLLALLVDEGGWFHAAKVVPYEAVRSLGENAVMVDNEAAIVSAREDSRIGELLKSKQKSLIGLKLLTTDGRDLGRISDVYVEAVSGQVVGYEATGGFFADMSSGRTFVPAPQSITIGADAAIVPPSVVTAMEESKPGGLQGAVQRAGDSVTSSVQDTVSSAKASYDETTSQVKTGVQGLGANLRAAYQDAAAQVRDGYQQVAHSAQEQLSDLQHATQERQAEFVLGKVAGQDVLTDNGAVVVAQGQVINQLHITQAQNQGLLLKLVTAASMGSVKQSTQHLAEQAREQVADVSEQVKAKVEPLREQAATLANQPVEVPAGVQRLVAIPHTPEVTQDIVGRRVLRDVYGDQHILIAAQGQIVSVAMVAQAKAQGQESGLISATQSAQVPLADQLSEGVAGMAASANTLLGRAKQWLGEKREEVADTVEQQQEEAQAQRIQAVLGRPVTRVILDPHDHIILNVGEVITNKAVQQAAQAGVLDNLLDSAHMG